MIGFKYQSYLTYSYTKSYDEMCLILNEDGFKDVEIIKSENIIKYTINNERVIRLDNLLYLFKIKYLRLTIAQLIQLCLEIVKKYQKLQSNSIEHNYLDLNRVLLSLHTKSEGLFIIPSTFTYDIHFTGYDCPFYERENYEDYTIQDSEAIKSIVNKIIDYTESYSMKQARNDQTFPSITELLRMTLNSSFNSFIHIIEEHFISSAYINNQQQALTNLDKQFMHLNYKRNMFKGFVQSNLEILIKRYYSINNWYIYEYYLYQTLPKITKEFRKSTLLFISQSPEKEIQYTPYENEFDNLDNDFIDQIITQQIESFNQFKLDLNKSDIRQTAIVALQQQMKFLQQYFRNDANFMNANNINNNIKHLTLLKQRLTERVVQEVFSNQFQLQNLQWINEII
ncbi:unnamed protein product (macronuclear) [Paramecium tetraurelia]|uniref:Uncharacterized protein n=1 Tax=Paramecium tetraurelia TaxID=5888 RepID=A0D8R0_PARTE|nr:uncharacterized protein GSPATT00014373001 [Paramecium tetraurelia]CAK79427.1 unnamed protein product [Paramecium tetraurelia]|eukprot:XP_001446824.1 hypothetical protein (macronuclear) [Paramecium tetraurelia strain d4-2]